MDKEYDVYDIDNKKHEGYNGVSKTWWIYYSDRLPDELLPSIDSEYLIPYHVSISRLVWDIRFTQRVTTKEKWNRTQFNNNTKCEMWCNGKLIYSFNTIGGEEGSKRLQTLNVINANLADKYQGGTTDGKEGTSNEGI